MIFRWLAEQGIDPAKNKLIKNGSKIVMMEACGVTLKDSYNFLPMPLSKLPASFELEELAKGHFPHFFNTPENEDYVGSWPDKKYYAPDSMKPAAREKFLRWYEDQKHKVRMTLYLIFTVHTSCFPFLGF